MSKSDQKNSVKLERGVPLPLSQRGKNSYSLDQMQIGDSFAVPLTELANVRRSASYFGLTRQRKFSVRKIENGSYRCWRVS